MSDHDNDKPSLSQLYRRFAGARFCVPEADDILQLAKLAHAEDAASPLCADLLRFSRELEASSAQLSADVMQAFEQSTPLTHRRAAPRRAVAAVARRWRGIAAIAASLVALIGAWTVSQPQRIAPSAPSVARSAAPPVQDRIFAGLDDSAVASNSRNDEIFRDQFSSNAISSDVIFRSHDG